MFFVKNEVGAGFFQWGREEDFWSSLSFGPGSFATYKNLASPDHGRIDGIREVLDIAKVGVLFS